MNDPKKKRHRRNNCREQERRDAFGWRMLDTLRRDGKHAVRRLGKDWQFSAGAIGILALGIGANPAVFSTLNNTLFQPHPFTDSERLVNLYQNDAKSGEPEGVSYPAFLDLQKETAVFEGVGAANLTEGRYQTVDAQGRPGSIRGGLFEYASANYLDVLGMRPSLGRWFTAGEERRAEPVAVLGWTAWTRHFGADPNVLGQTLIVGGTPVQVIGVGPMALHSSPSNALVASLWMPIGRTDLQPSSGVGASPGLLEKRESLFLQVRARLLGGVTIQQAQAAMNVTARRLAADNPDTDPKRGITVLATDDVHVHPREKRLKPVATAGMIVVTWLVVGDVTALVVTGIAIGSALSWTGVTLLESSVAQILGVNPLALAPVAVIIVACGAAAAWVPARRAVLTDPIAAIRHQ
jgi:putative ABC transport system permease protein